jgi:hypothetical protein
MIARAEEDAVVEQERLQPADIGDSTSHRLHLPRRKYEISKDFAKGWSEGVLEFYLH